MADKHWIQQATGGSHRGALHRALGVPEGQKIPPAKMAQAAKSTNPRIEHMVALAHTLRSMHKS